MPLAPSLDHCGSFARSVTDAAAIWSVLADRPMRPAGALTVPRLAVAPELLARADPPLRAHLDDVIARLRGAGAGVDAVELGFAIDSVVDAGRTVMAVEASRAHAPAFAQYADEYGPGIAGLIRAGQAVTPEALAEATRVRSACRAAVGSLLDGIDALLSPVAFGAAPPLGGGTGDFSLCLPWSFIGVPSLSIPTGLDASGLPFAIQLTGGTTPDAVDRLLAAATWCERVIGFGARPPLEARATA